MVELRLHGRKVESIFQLLGEQENDITYSVGWALARCPFFLRAFLEKVVVSTLDLESVLVRLQQHAEDKGFTDIEIEAPSQFHMIIEAKRGWNLPNRKQLEKYATRFSKSGATLERLVVMSECSKEYAKSNLEAEIAGVSVKPVSWKEVAALARDVLNRGSHEERRLLRELLTYLGRIVGMQNTSSNEVYVVSLRTKETPEGWGISWIDIVEKRGHYFHPAAERPWPKDPPNYIAFRYEGRLQSIHHIESYEVVTNFRERITEAPDKEQPPHFLYTLGPAFGPDKEIRTGKNIRQARHARCMLDTLFTCETISEAEKVSKERKEKL